MLSSTRIATELPVTRYEDRNHAQNRKAMISMVNSKHIVDLLCTMFPPLCAWRHLLLVRLFTLDMMHT